jgi:hypothetical protein
VTTDPAKAGHEVRQLVAMVQQTLEATKSFIFDVRPMVLDDLGLVPTLRRAARERGRRAGVPVEFDSMGQDRRLPMDLESGLFRRSISLLWLITGPKGHGCIPRHRDPYLNKPEPHNLPSIASCTCARPASRELNFAHADER